MGRCDELKPPLIVKTFAKGELLERAALGNRGRGAPFPTGGRIEARL